MELTESQFKRIDPFLPRQRGNGSLGTRQVLNAIWSVAEQGGKWSGLPRSFGNWHPISTRMNRWAQAGDRARVFTAWQQQQIIRSQVEAVSRDRSAVKVHPDGTGALQKTARKLSGTPALAGPPRCIWLPRKLERPSPVR